MVGGFFVDDNMDSRGCNWGVVEFIVAVDLGPGREFGVDAGTM